MTEEQTREQVAQNDWQKWQYARMQELKRSNPSRSKKDCWRYASKEWAELRRQYKREQREKAAAAERVPCVRAQGTSGDTDPVLT